MTFKREHNAKAPLRSLTVMLTSGCNLQCQYCYRSSQGTRRLAWPDLRRALSWACSEAGSQLEVLFSGGEPLLAFKQLARAVVFLSGRSARRPRIRFKLLTNGTLLTDAITDFLVKHDCALRLSFDGVPAAQKLRGPGTFDLLDRRIRSLRRRHEEFFRHRLTVATTVLPETVPYLAQSVSALMEMGIQRIALAPLLTPSPSGAATDVVALEQQFGQIFERSLRHKERTGEVPLGLFVRYEPDLSRQERQGAGQCNMARGIAPVVDVDGTIHACEAFSGAAAVRTNPAHRELLDLVDWGRPERAEFAKRRRNCVNRARHDRLLARQAKRFSTYGRCDDCGYVADCLVCPVAIASHGQNENPRRVPDFLCAFHRVAFAHRQRFPAQPWPETFRRHPARLASSLDTLAKNLLKPRIPRSRRP